VLIIKFLVAMEKERKPVNDNVFIALLHWPVLGKDRKTPIITSFTPLDLHDIARPARTYEINTYYIVQPLEAQQEIIEKQISYWKNEGGKLNPTRKEAVSIVKVVYTLDEAIEDIIKRRNRELILIGTSAKRYPNTVSYQWLAKKIQEERDKDFLIIFGTGYGIVPSLMETFDYILEPIMGAGDWNHLSVRNAVAIILDRLLSPNRC